MKKIIKQLAPQYEEGKLVTTKTSFDIIIWSDGFDAIDYHIVDRLYHNEVAIVIACEDKKLLSQGWVRLLNARGKIGYINGTDLKGIVNLNAHVI